MKRALAIAVVLAASTTAHAWPLPQAPLPEPDPEPEPEPKPAPAPEPPKPAEPTLTRAQLDEELAKIDDRMHAVEKKQREFDSTVDQVKSLMPLSRYIIAYIDVGAFAVSGDGSGIRSDFLHTNYPQYRNTVSGQWVFMGDPFTTAINTLGEPAETASSREVPTDTINSGGHAAFIVNTVGLRIEKGIDPDLVKGVSISALVQLLPRSGPDILDISYAHIDYRPTESDDLVLQAGKIESVLGVEYRSQDAWRRTGITPSLICRYLCGRPIGVGGRLVETVHDDERSPVGVLSLSASVTNGDNFEERFEPKDQLKPNRYPTAAGHVQWMFLSKEHVGRSLEVGVSGAFGPQDGQANGSIHQWHYGVDLNLIDRDEWHATAEFVQGKQQGSSTGDATLDRMNSVVRPACDVAQCLTYKGAYLLVDKQVTKRFAPYVRVDWRDATHRDGANFVYESHSIRGTFGVNLNLSKRVVAKAEYNWNHELGVPHFPHDVITSSIVVSTN